ncbi:MAG: cupin domain-containing protein [Proteobacteria bacterium]|nr:cupin domain-containing protein [Pseudomonadota bacterium]
MKAKFQTRKLDEMIEGALSALKKGGTSELPLIDGRIVSVHASPAKGSSEKMAMGVSALPANYSTPVHSHEAEEFALVMRGAGVISVDGVDIPVTAGSIVTVAPNIPHVTTANSDGPMVVYWTYSPAGSESRWDPKGEK